MSINKNNAGVEFKSSATSSAASKDSNTLVVRIDKDSENNFQALFDSVLNPGDSKRPLQVPFRMRNLPNSFFTPPAVAGRTPVSHSRTNSADSAYDTGSQSNVNQVIVAPAAATPQPCSVLITPQPSVNRQLISHSRAHSSPASLQQTYAMRTSVSDGSATCGQDELGAGFNFNSVRFGSSANSNAMEIERPNQCPNPSNPTAGFHMKQRSYDVVSPIQLQNELGALPPGWEQAKTNDGQIYYLNHATKTTQWEDPRIQLKQQRSLQQSLNQTTAEVKNKEPGQLHESVGPLPEGWEQALTESGDIYFINHINRTTSWNDPRLTDYIQKNSKIPKYEMSWVNVRQLEKDPNYFKQKTEQSNLARPNPTLQMDPFLSGDSHARQESSDSGLSLSSNTFSVNTDLLSQIDDSMDCMNENSSINVLNVLDCADNLVSSLQLEDNLCNEMFNDVHGMLNTSSNKPDTLDWYKIN